MRQATKAFTATFGAVMALAGIEHGIGEILQGSKAPDGIMILSWPHSAFFRSLSGEPAMTVIPNLLATGILAVLFSLALLIWATRFVERRHYGLVIILLSVAMLLTGGGIFPPVLGILIGVVGTRIQAPAKGRKTQTAGGWKESFGKIWPWAFGACVLSWLLLLPGVPLLDHFFGVDNAALTAAFGLLALGSLLATIFSGAARDLRRG